jgi:hypothetical protein
MYSLSRDLRLLLLHQILGRSDILFGDRSFHPLYKDRKGIVAIAWLRLRYNERLFLFQNLGSSTVFDPSFLKLSQMGDAGAQSNDYPDYANG